MRRYPCEKIEPRRVASIVRRFSGPFRSTFAMGRANHARRGDDSGRLTWLPRSQGETISRFSYFSSGPLGFLALAMARVPGLATGFRLLAFAPPAVAQTSVNRMSSARLAPDRIVTSFKVGNAQALTVGSHPHGYKLSSVDLVS